VTDRLQFPAVRLLGRDLLFSTSDKALIRAWFSTQPAPFAMVTFQRVRRPRTTGRGSQSHRINGFIAQIAEATDDDFDRLKVELKQKAISRGWPFHYAAVMDRNGVMHEMTIAKSEADATVEEASALIGVVEQYAAERGVVLREE